MNRGVTTLIVCTAMAAAASGCGSSASSSSTAPSSAGGKSSSASGASTGGGSTPGAGALSAEATSAATGDIPDNQAFLTFHNAAGGYSISYPEGWARKGTGTDTTFADKNNVVHIVIANGGPPSLGSVAAELTRLKQSNRSLTFTAPKTVQLKSGPAVKVTYTTRSAPNPVTGKTVLLIVDRYELSKAGKTATLDLGTPKGVDNVDAYRMMSNSFRWL